MCAFLNEMEFFLQNAEAKGDSKMALMLKTAEAHCKVLKKRMARTGLCFKATTALIAAGAGIAYAFYLLNLDISVR